MTESVNHAECGHNCNPSELTGPVVITKPSYNNITLHLPINKDTTGHEPEEEASQGTAIMFTGVTDSCRLRFYKASNETNFSGGFDDGVFEIATSDNANEPIYCRQYLRKTDSETLGYDYLRHELALLDSTGTTNIERLAIIGTPIYDDNYNIIGHNTAKLYAWDNTAGKFRKVKFTFED